MKSWPPSKNPPIKEVKEAVRILTENNVPKDAKGYVNDACGGNRSKTGMDTVSSAALAR